VLRSSPPVGSGSRIVVRERNDIAVDFVEAGVERRNDSTRANLDGLQAIRRRRAFEKFARLHVAVAINDDDEIGRSLLPI